LLALHQWEENIIIIKVFTMVVVVEKDCNVAGGWSVK